VHLGAVLKLFAGALESLFQGLLGAGKFLELKILEALFVGTKLSELSRGVRVWNGRAGLGGRLQGLLFH
jgi:hypothetical protein